MKRILITGVNSYVGNSFVEWLERYSKDYEIDKISLRDGSWKEKDFSKYDSILHVAGIAHRKESKRNEHLYYEVNRDITKEIAHKAKNESVPHFVFLSTMSVYGLTEGIIDKSTPLKPNTHYGKSKLQAEEYISSLNTEDFKVAILRPPMIYGKNCEGNYQKLRKIALISPIFPDIRNRRSMIFIENLSNSIMEIINNNRSGTYFPQNNKYVKTTLMVQYISTINNKNIRTSKLLAIFIEVAMKRLTVFKKVFGSLIYDYELTKDNNNQFNFLESISRTER